MTSGGGTGATQATLDPSPGPQGLLQISPDFMTFFFGDAPTAPSTLKRYDVSTANPTLLETSDSSTTGNGGVDLSSVMTGCCSAIRMSTATMRTRPRR